MGLHSAEVALAVLIPEELAKWAKDELLGHAFELTVGNETTEVLSEHAEMAKAAAEAVPERSSVTLQMELLGFAEVSGQRFRRLRLEGPPGRVSAALQIVRRRLRRFLRWTSAVDLEPPWHLWEEKFLEETEGDFISTENFFLKLSSRHANLLSASSGNYAELLFQIKEDSGAATRVQVKTPNETATAMPCVGADCLEIAGGFAAKLQALLDLCSLILQMPLDESQEAEVALLLPSLGPCAFNVAEALTLARSATASAASIAGEDRVILKLKGSQVAVCSSAMAVCRASERKAYLHERKHGPPALLVDYLSRWFGRDAGRLLRQRRTNTKRGNEDFDDDHDEKRPKMALTELPVIEGMVGPLPQQEQPCTTEVDVAPGLNEDGSESSEEVELPAAETLPFFTDNLAVQLTELPTAVDHKDAAQEDDAVQSAAASAAESSDEELQQNAAEEAAVPLKEQHAPIAPPPPPPDDGSGRGFVSDSDSDYYRPGPQEDPLWAKRQEILKKLKGM